MHLAEQAATDEGGEYKAFTPSKRLHAIATEHEFSSVFPLELRSRPTHPGKMNWPDEFGKLIRLQLDILLCRTQRS